MGGLGVLRVSEPSCLDVMLSARQDQPGLEAAHVSCQELTPKWARASASIWSAQARSCSSDRRGGFEVGDGAGACCIGGDTGKVGAKVYEAVALGLASTAGPYYGSCGLKIRERSASPRNVRIPHSHFRRVGVFCFSKVRVPAACIPNPPASTSSSTLMYGWPAARCPVRR